MTTEELAKFDGRNGRAAYVAVNRTIYDVSGSQYWQEGKHQGVHQAGRDLSEELKSAPHGTKVIEGFPVVGKIKNRFVKKPQPSTRMPLLSIIIIAFVVLLMLATYMI